MGRRSRIGIGCILVVGALACGWLHLRSRDASASAVLTNVFELEYAPTAAMRVNAPLRPVAPGRKTDRAPSAKEVVGSFEYDPVVVTSINPSSVQAGGAAPLVRALPSEPDPSSPTPSHDELAAQWAAEQSAKHFPGDGKQFAVVAQLGVDPKMVLGTECRTSVCRVEVVIPWADPEPEQSTIDGLRPADNPDPDRDITTLFYPRAAPETGPALTE